MIYLAQPYSHPDPAVRQHRYEEARLACAALANSGRLVYAPIVHWHETAVAHNMPKDFPFWETMNYGMLDVIAAGRHPEMCILLLDGWKESVGIAGEFKHAFYAGRFIFNGLQPVTHPAERLHFEPLPLLTLAEIFDGENPPERHLDAGSLSGPLSG